MVLTDWYHESAFDIARQALQQSLGVPPVQPNALINGKNVYHNQGSRYSTVFEPGKKHLLRLINTGSEVTFRFSIDGHQLQVVGMDWVPITPYTADSILIGVGQRYDVIVTANKTPKDYWMRAIPQQTCLALNINALNVRGIIRYDASSTSDPTTLPNTLLDLCVDERPNDLCPYHVHNVGASDVTPNLQANLLSDPQQSLALRWNVGADPYRPAKNSPAVKLLMNGQNLPDEMSPLDVGSLGADKWVYVILQSLLPIVHPVSVPFQPSQCKRCD